MAGSAFSILSVKLGFDLVPPTDLATATGLMNSPLLTTTFCDSEQEARISFFDTNFRLGSYCCRFATGTPERLQFKNHNVYHLCALPVGQESG